MIRSHLSLLFSKLNIPKTCKSAGKIYINTDWDSWVLPHPKCGSRQRSPGPMNSAQTCVQCTYCHCNTGAKALSLKHRKCFLCHADNTYEQVKEHESLQIFQKTLAGCKHSADDRMFYDYTFLSTLRQSAKEFEDETSGLWNVHLEQKGEEQAFHKPLKRKGNVSAKLLKLHVCLCSHLQLQINNYSKQKTSLIEFQTAKAHLFSYQYHCHLPGELLYKSRKKGRFLLPSQKKKIQTSKSHVFKERLTELVSF